MGQSNSHKKMRSVPEYSLVSTTQADKEPQCPTAAVCMTALWALLSAVVQGYQLGGHGSLSARE
jgi:hypothetical protein